MQITTGCLIIMVIKKYKNLQGDKAFIWGRGGGQLHHMSISSYMPDQTQNLATLISYKRHFTWTKHSPQILKADKCLCACVTIAAHDDTERRQITIAHQLCALNVILLSARVQKIHFFSKAQPSRYFLDEYC